MPAKQPLFAATVNHFARQAKPDAPRFPMEVSENSNGIQIEIQWNSK